MGVLPFCRDAVYVFCSPSPLSRVKTLATIATCLSLLAHHTGDSSKCGRYFCGILFNKVLRLFWICFISRTHVGGVLHLCREAVNVFCSPSRLGKTHHWGVRGRDWFMPFTRALAQCECKLFQTNFNLACLISFFVQFTRSVCGSESLNLTKYKCSNCTS